jgi:hypothetical protein
MNSCTAAWCVALVVHTTTHCSTIALANRSIVHGVVVVYDSVYDSVYDFVYDSVYLNIRKKECVFMDCIKVVKHHAATSG